MYILITCNHITNILQKTNSAIVEHSFIEVVYVYSYGKEENIYKLVGVLRRQPSVWLNETIINLNYYMFLDNILKGSVADQRISFFR